MKHQAKTIGQKKVTKPLSPLPDDKKKSNAGSLQQPKITILRCTKSLLICSETNAATRVPVLKQDSRWGRARKFTF